VLKKEFEPLANIGISWKSKQLRSGKIRSEKKVQKSLKKLLHDLENLLNCYRSLDAVTSG